MTGTPTIFLCGFMGSGKTTLGRKSAALLGLEFYDLDDAIEEQEEKSISVIFETEGEAEFRKKERYYLEQLLLNPLAKLISLGGGTVCFENNLERIKQEGLLIYIELPANALAKRLSATKKKRPLLEGMNESEILSYIKTLLQVRKVFYEQAHKTVNGINLNPQHLVNEIKALL